MTPITISDTLPEAIPALYEGPALDLPPAATQNEDGSVTLALAHPKTIKFSAGGTVTELPIETLTFYRLTGAETRKIIAARDPSLVGFAASARVTPARANLMINALDAVDGMDAAKVVTELLGGPANALPEQAAQTPDGVTLTLLFPTTDDEGTEYTELAFGRFSVAQRNKAQAQPDIMDFVVGQITGLPPKRAHDLLDRMDGADLRSVNRVIGFLFGLFR